MLEAKNLKKYYNSTNQIKAVDDITFSVNKGEFVAIVGKSGSGKTTLLNLLGALDTPTEGEVIISEESIFSLGENERTVFRRKNIGFVFQSFNLLQALSVYENIILPVKLDGKDVDTELLDEIIDKLELREKLNEYPTSLSGGQQQRVAIARAILQKPKLVFADEPTGNLDTATSEEVIELFKLMKERFGQTVIIITHNEAIAKTADRIITIEDGRLK